MLPDGYYVKKLEDGQYEYGLSKRDWNCCYYNPSVRNGVYAIYSSGVAWDERRGVASSFDLAMQHAKTLAA